MPPCQCLSDWISVGAAVIVVTVYVCVTVLSLSSVCLSLCLVAVSLCLRTCLCLIVSSSYCVCLSLRLLHCVFVTEFYGFVYVADILGLPISVSVCHCPTFYVSPSTQVSRCYSPPRPQVGVSGPLVPEPGPSPSHPLLP